MATKTSSTEVTQQKKVIVKSEEALNEMAKNGLIEPFTDYYTPEEDTNFSQMRTIELWENKSPSDTFASQTITLSSDDYDYLIIMYCYVRGSTLKSQIIEKNKNAYLDCSWANNPAKNINAWRTVIFTDNTHLLVEDCQVAYPTVGSVYINNEFCVPYKIIGLKKEPAMIYTGDELHEGDGIYIKDGTISVKKWKTFIGEAGSENYLPINWNELSEISFRVLGSDQATFGYVHIPKEFWHNDGEYILEVNCINEYGTFKGAMWFQVIGKYQTSIQIKATVKSSAQSDFTIAYR